MHKSFPTAISVLLLSGCSYIPWFGGEKDPRPPTELEKRQPEITVNKLWSNKVGEGADERRLDLVPAIQGGRLYVADAEGTVFAMNAATGNVLWQRETGLPFSGGPEVDGRYIVLGSGNGDLVALNIQDGTPLWNARVDSEVLSVPRIAGSSVVVHTLHDSVYAFDLTSGDQRWKYIFPAPILTLRGSSSPAITGDSAIVGISGGKLLNLELETGVPLWETTVTPPHGRSELERIADLDADPVIVDGIVYVATYNGDLAAVDLSTGAVLWRRELSAHAGITAESGMLYVTDSDDVVWAASPQDGTGTWKQEALKYRRLTAPAVLGNLVVVGDLDGYLHWLDRRDGRIVASDRVAGGPITARPQVSGGKLYVYGDDGTVAALSAGSPPSRPRAPKPAPQSQSSEDRSSR